MISLITEGQVRLRGINLFHYPDDRHISGIFLTMSNWRVGVRWNRPNGLKPHFSFDRRP